MDTIRNITNYTRQYVADVNDGYCRYMNIGIPYSNANYMCGLYFLNFFKSKFGIERLPYNIKIKELILCGALIPSLFVHLPPNIDDSDENFLDKLLSFPFVVSNKVQELSHPYDTSLKETFVKEFKTDIPRSLKFETNGSERQFSPYEAYLPYWKSYILLLSINDCMFIDRYLPPDEGKKIFIDNVQEREAVWEKNFSETFERISWCRTVYHKLEKINITGSDFYSYILKNSNSKLSDFDSDMDVLLKLYSKISLYFEKYKFDFLNNMLEEVRYDVYCVVMMLCYSGRYTELDLFNKWHTSGRDQYNWTSLREVLPFEEFKFKIKFETYVPSYLEETPLKNFVTSWSELYDKLARYDGFECWIRAFVDMHSALESPAKEKKRMSFRQGRLLDHLLVITLRSEVFLRSLLKKNSSVSENEPYELKIVLGQLGELAKKKSSSEGHCIVSRPLSAVVSQWKDTRLNEKPEDLFESIESSTVGKKWTNDERQAFKFIMEFVVARNYFAHHSYKDSEMKRRSYELPRKVLVACLFSVIQIAISIDEPF